MFVSFSPKDFLIKWGVNSYYAFNETFEDTVITYNYGSNVLEKGEGKKMINTDYMESQATAIKGDVIKRDLSFHDCFM